MSYCVNCGVELDASAEACPLCNTPVINPKEIPYSKKMTPFPKEKGQVELVKRKDLAILLSVVTRWFYLMVVDPKFHQRCMFLFQPNILKWPILQGVILLLQNLPDLAILDQIFQFLSSVCFLFQTYNIFLNNKTVFT